MDAESIDFAGLLVLLLDAGVAFAVAGGTAAVLHGGATATYDLDIVMEFNPDNCARLLSALSDVEPRLSHTADKRPLTLTAAELTGFKNLYLTTRLGRLDVLGALPPVASAQEVLGDAETVRLNAGHTVLVVSLPMLIQVKAALGRPKDRLVEAELRAIEAVRQKRGS